MRSNYEEKTYENYFNEELSERSNIYFPLGQVQEGILGFDSSAYSQNRHLWRSVSYPFTHPFRYKGLYLTEVADEMEHFLNIEINNIPKMKANILFQYKKPEYIISHAGTEWSSWKQSYFRYDIYLKQQRLLSHIDASLGKKLLVVYASPAVKDVDDLVTKKINHQIINSSNFSKAKNLNNHKTNTYIEEGTYSLAFSESERIDNLNLLGEIEILGNDNLNSNEDNRQFIIRFQRQISSMMNEDNYYNKTYTKLNALLLEIRKYELLYSLFVMRNFKQLTGIQWLIKL